jgi:hypothetical protein
MAINYAYAFAEIDNETNMCVGVVDTTNPEYDGYQTGVSFYVRIPVYDEEYCFKYYLNGNWYEDAEGTIPWQSSML